MSYEFAYVNYLWEMHEQAFLLYKGDYVFD